MKNVRPSEDLVVDREESTDEESTDERNNATDESVSNTRCVICYSCILGLMHLFQ